MTLFNLSPPMLEAYQPGSKNYLTRNTKMISKGVRGSSLGRIVYRCLVTAPPFSAVLTNSSPQDVDAKQLDRPKTISWSDPYRVKIDWRRKKIGPSLNPPQICCCHRTLVELSGLLSVSDVPESNKRPFSIEFDVQLSRFRKVLFKSQRPWKVRTEKLGTIRSVWT